MWILQSVSDPGQCFRLLCGREYSVGRRDCDVLVENDMSISRKHATLSISHPENQVMKPQCLPILTLQDLSRLGSLVGETRVIKDTCVVNDGNMIVFGTAGTSRYRAQYEPYLTTTSCLDAPGRTKTRQLIGRLGGHVTNDWRHNCKLLVMNNLSITIKAICALITQRPIVTPLYLEDFVKSLDTNSAEPNSDDYLPPLAESQLDPAQISFKPDPRRRKVFQGHIFIFLNAKQFKKLSIAVELGGGTPMLMEEGSDDNEDDILFMPGSCIMSCDLVDQSQPISKNAQDWIQHVMNTLKKHRKRPIQECEIGYAVLHVSVDKHCNPNEKNSMAGGCAAVVPQTLSQMDMNTSQLRASDTQTRDSSERPTTLNRKPASKIKCEPESQKKSTEMTEECTARTSTAGKKRAMENDAFDQESTSAKQTAVENARGSVTRIKEEPITPQKPASNNNSTVKNDAMDTAVPSRGKRKSRSPSPNPAVPRRVSPRSKRETDLDLFDSELTTNSRKTRKSPSPGPECSRNSRTNARQSSPSPEKPQKKGGLFARKNPGKRPHDDSDEDNDDDVPGKRLRVKQESKGFTRRERSPELLSDENEPLDSDGEVDMFSLVPTRKGRSQAGSSAPKRERRSLSPPREQKVKKEERNVSDSDDIRIPETAEEEMPRPSTSRAQSHRVPAADGGHSSTLNDRPRVATDLEEAVPVKSEFEYDPQQPSNQMVIEEASLLVRKPGQAKKPQENRWQGKIIKNFKKFRKTAHAGSTGLPQVIGGNDLIVDDTPVNKELQAWFKECIESETQQSHRDREDEEELLNFVTKSGKSKGKSTRGRKR